jgi:hypothetical protein
MKKRDKDDARVKKTLLNIIYFQKGGVLSNELNEGKER